MINKIYINSTSVNFKGNINTRKLLELADAENYNGRPVIERLNTDKLERISRYKKRNNCGVYQIYRSCSRKVKRFANELLAEKATRRAEKRLGIKFSSYHCPICQQWHICKTENKFPKSWD